MSLNAFEIRLELLKLAQLTLSEQALSSRQVIMDRYWNEKENNLTISFPLLPDMPKTEDIIAEAEKLNAFVSGR